MISRKTILLFISGDESATATVYQEYKRLLFFVIASYVDDQEDANDVLHDAFLKALEHRDSLKDPNKLKTFLCAIAKNEAIDFVRKKHADFESETIDEIYGEEDSNGLLSAIEPLLSNKEAIVVYYKAIFGYTWKEIVEETGIPDSTARLLYKQGIEKLRKEWKK